MRIATWNLERGGTARARDAQERILGDLAADVAVLTEPPDTYRSGAGIVTSPQQREGKRGHEAWVAIVGPSVEPIPLDVPFHRMAAAARATVGGRSVIIYGAVLPWLAVTSHAPELVRDGETSFDAFKRVLAEQMIDIPSLRRSHVEPLVWAGDFNQTVTGPVAGCSWERQAVLNESLGALGFTAWNGAAAHARPGLCSVDLVCGPQEHEPVRQGRIDPVSGGVLMSDHAGYWIEL